MRDIKVEAYNKTFSDRIEKLREATKSVSPENMCYIDGLLVNEPEKINGVKYIFDDNSTINGVDVYKLTSILNAGKLFKIETNNIQGRVLLRHAGQYSVPVPVNYDGRNSIVFASADGKEDVDIIKDWFNKTLEEEEVSYSFSVAKNKTSIDFNIRGYGDDLLDRYLDYTIFFWRSV